MKQIQGLNKLWLIGVLAVLVTQPAAAELESPDSAITNQALEREETERQAIVEIPRLDESETPRLNALDQPATTVDEWLAQSEEWLAQSLVQVTGVRLNPTADGLEVVLETAAGQLPPPPTSVVGNALIAEIPNAVVALPDQDEFQAANLAEGIALISVTGLPDDRVRVAITGIDAPPSADVRAEAQGIGLSVAPGAEGTEADEEDAIQGVVTGEQEGRYQVDRVTTATRTETVTTTLMKARLLWVCNLSRDAPSLKGVRSQEPESSPLLTPDFCARGISRLVEYALLSIVRTVLGKVPETPIAPSVLALTLKPSSKLGEGLQSGSPSPFLGEGAGG